VFLLWGGKSEGKGGKRVLKLIWAIRDRLRTRGSIGSVPRQEKLGRHAGTRGEYVTLNKKGERDY